MSDLAIRTSKMVYKYDKKKNRLKDIKERVIAITKEKAIPSRKMGMCCICPWNC